MLPSVSWAEAALIAAILAPTDAALGIAVVTNPAVPVRIRRALNIESGLNDGIATPFVTVFLAWSWWPARPKSDWGIDAVFELARGAAIGIGIGYLGGWLVRRAKTAEWSTPLSDQLVVLSLAFLAYGAAVNFSGNGFVAAFVAGLVFGAASRGQLHEATEFTDTVGLFSSFVVWVIFGAAFVGPVLRGGVHLRPVLYAVLSLTVVRMLPVAISLIGARLPHRHRRVHRLVRTPRPRLGRLHPHRLRRAQRPRHSPTRLVEITTWTILLSVVAHGLSSGPLAAAYGRHVNREPADAPELTAVAPTRIRKRSLL